MSLTTPYLNHQATRPIPWRLVALAIAAIVTALAIGTLPLPVVAVGLAGVLLVALVLRWPLAGLGAALLLGPFGALENIILGNALLDSGQLLLLLTIGAWLSASLGRRRLWLAQTPLNWPLAIFILTTAITLLGADSLPLGLREILKWLEIGLITLLVLDIATDGGRSVRDLTPATRWLLLFLFLAGLAQALIGIWQFGLRGTGPEHFLVLGQYYRAYGTFEQPNPFGGYVNLTALLALGAAWGLVAFWAERQPAERDPLSSAAVLSPRWIWLAVAALVGVSASLAVVFSWSRGAWLGFIAGLAVLVLFAFKRWWVGAFALGLGVATLVLGLGAGVAVGLGPAQSVADRLLGFREDFALGDVRGVDINDANYAVLERLAHWQAALDMARDNIWTGVGFGNYEAAYARYALINWPAALGHAHNYYLNLLAETGLVGIMAYCLLWVVILGQSWLLLRRLAWPDRGIVLGLLAAWVALAVHHLVDKLYVNNIYLHLGAMIALLQLMSLRVKGLESVRRS